VSGTAWTDFLAEWLEQLGAIEFLSPRRAWIAVPALLVVIAAPLLRRHARGPVALSLVLRTIAIASLLAVICEPFFVEQSERSGRVVALADVSPSVGEAGIEETRAYLAAANRTPGVQPDLGAFGSSTLPVATPQELAPDPAPITDLAGGLRFAAARAGGERPARIIVFTDGRPTTGPADATAERLRDQGLEIVAIGVPGTTPPAPPAVELTELKALEVEEPGAMPTLRALAVAADDTQTRATLYIDGKPAGSRDWPLVKGPNELLVPLPDLPPGRYNVQLVVEGDLSPDDNNGETTITVRGAPKVLLLAADERKALIAEALRAQGMEIKVASVADAGPFDVYDAIVVLPDADAEALDQRAGDLAAFVGTRGGGLLAVGGSEGPGLARFAGSPTAFLLPVEVEPRRSAEEEPAPPEENKDPQPRIEIKEEKTQAYPITLCLLVDRSGSMQGEKMRQAKIAAASAARALTPQDRICVIAFGNQADVILAPQPAGDWNRVMQAIGPLPAAGRTAMYAALKSAYALLDKEKSPIRHLVLISDGESTDNGPWLDLVVGGASRKITLSAVGIGFQVDRRHLGRLSTWGKGKSWSVVHASEIPQVVTQDTLRVVRTRNERGKDAERSAGKDEPKKKDPEPEPEPKDPASEKPPTPPERVPGVALRTDPSAPREMFKGIPDEELPEVSGVEPSKPRFASWVAASAGEGEEESPVVAYRRFGIGTSAALLLDPESRGAQALREHAEFSKLMAQLVRSILPDGSTAKVQARTRLSDRGTRLDILVFGEDGQRRTDLDVTLELGDESLPVTRRSSRYEVGLPLRKEVTTARVRIGPPDQPLLDRHFVVPASRDPERAATGIDHDALVRLTGAAARVDLPPAEALDPPVAPVATSRPLGLPFLCLAAILLPLDAWARRRARSVSQSRQAILSASDRR